MQQTLISFARDRIFGLLEIESYRAIFHNDRAARSREKIFYRFDQGFRSHGKKCFSNG
jgi:hypothetical protein